MSFDSIGVKDLVMNVNFETECKLNTFSSRKSPFCSLCSLLTTRPVRYETIIHLIRF